MAYVRQTVTEDIENNIAVGLTAYDSNREKIGTVGAVDRQAGYVTVESSAFSDQDMLIPFNLITNIDPREVFFSKSKAELRAGYTNPPPRSTVVEDSDGGETATTTEPSGYDGAPLLVDQVKIEDLKRRIVPGDRVYSSDMADLGTIKQYDPATGWMLIDRGVLSGERDLLVPVTLVGEVDQFTHDVALVWSEAQLQQLQNSEPVNVVFVEAKLDG